MWGRGQRGNNTTCLAVAPPSVSSPANHKWITHFWCWIPGGWACVHTRTPWVPPRDSPVRLGDYLGTVIPMFLHPEVLRLYFPVLEPCDWWTRQSHIRVQINWHQQLLRLTPSGLQHQGGGLRGTSGVQGEAEMSGIKVSRGHCPLSGLSSHRAGRLRFH